jgi:general stress protein YciG
MAKKSASKLSKAARDFFVAAGRKGGQKTGPTKARDPEKMREAQKLRWAKNKPTTENAEQGTENAEH